jgi:hypothetical protein
LPWETNDKMPYEIAINKSRTNFFMLPFFLGLIGMFFHLFQDRKGFSVNMLLFLLMGLGLVVYLNSPPVEPRERDYIYVGSFYAFCIWIGLGVMAFFDWVRRPKNELVAASLATAICLPVPMLMGADGWDAHNRSGRFHSVDQAKNTLSSCAPNAILFTGGDNDTFPLWYVQNVEGFRTDVRVVVLSYFSTDWYIEQMRRKTYLSEPMQFLINQNNYRQGKNDYVPLVKETEAPINLATYIKLIDKDDPRVQVPLVDGTTTAKLLSPMFALEIDSAAIVSKPNLVPKGKEKNVVSQMVFSLKEGRSGLYKSDLAILDFIVANNWERPIYFNNTSANSTNMNFDEYLQMEGMAFRLMPVLKTDQADYESGEVSTDVMLERIKQFEYRGFDNAEVQHDEEYRKFGVNARNMFFRLAFKLYAEDRKEEAKQVLDNVLTMIPDKSIPYSYYAARYVELYHLLGEEQKALDLAKVISDRSVESLDYIIRWKLEPLKANKQYDYLQQKSIVVLSQLSYSYRRLEADASQKLKRLEMMRDNKIVLTEAQQSELVTLQKQREKYAELYKYYSEVYAKMNAGLKDPVGYGKASLQLPSPTNDSTDK